MDRERLEERDPRLHWFLDPLASHPARAAAGDHLVAQTSVEGQLATRSNDPTLRSLYCPHCRTWLAQRATWTGVAFAFTCAACGVEQTQPPTTPTVVPVEGAEP